MKEPFDDHPVCEGAFEPCLFCSLSEEELVLMTAILTFNGLSSLSRPRKAAARELKTRLRDALIAKRRETVYRTREEILTAMKQGTITPAEARTRLVEVRGNA